MHESAAVAEARVRTFAGVAQAGRSCRQPCWRPIRRRPGRRALPPASLALGGALRSRAVASSRPRRDAARRPPQLPGRCRLAPLRSQEAARLRARLHAGRARAAPGHIRRADSSLPGRPCLRRPCAARSRPDGHRHTGIGECPPARPAAGRCRRSPPVSCVPGTGRAPPARARFGAPADARVTRSCLFGVSSPLYPKDIS